MTLPTHKLSDFGSYRLLLLALLSVCSLVNAEPARNPILHADVPDIAMIRVDDTYYMSSTTMHMSPGLPIMKSKDLINWELISYAYDRLADNKKLRLEDGQNAYGAGSWASSIRFHEGTYYVTTFASTTNRTHVYTTKDIEKGPWKEQSFRPKLHDHSLFFDDDGRVYMLHGGHNLRLTELLSDVSGVKPGGFDEVVIKEASLVAGPRVGLNAEGTQIFKINGKYYVLNITWPPGDMRTVILHRADKITGPYEGRVILHDQGVAQGGLIDTPEGDWFAYLFKDNGAVGRIPYLVPVEWKDGWPVLGTEGKVPVNLDLPENQTGVTGIVASDEFKRAADEPDFSLAWQWNHNPSNEHWSLDARKGFFRLTTGRVDTELLQSRNMLTQRTFGPTCSASVSVDVSQMKDGDYAGFTALQKDYGFVGVKQVDGVRSLVVKRAKDGVENETVGIPLEQATVHLKISCDFSKEPELASFSCSLNGEDWHSIGEPLTMVYTLPHFMGYRFGLTNYATQQTGGYVDFDYYRIGKAAVQE